MNTLTTKQFIVKSIEINGDRYDYSLVEYINNKTKIKILCNKHGVFEQTPNDHLKGSGCKACSYETQAKTRAATAKSEFATKSNLIHNSKYDYSLVEYTNCMTKVKIMCPQHGAFLQKPNDHLNGSGCALCSLQNTGWTRTHFKDKCIKNNDSQGILYILECFNDSERFFKIGITSRSVKRRYPTKASMPYEYTILHEISGDPEFIYDLETLLHRKSKNYKYTPNVPFKGHVTECFEADPTYLDKLNNYLEFKNR